MTILIPRKFLKNMNGQDRQGYEQLLYWREDLEVSFALLFKWCCKSAVKDLVVLELYYFFVNQRQITSNFFLSFCPASGFQTGIKRKREDEDDGDLNIDGDDSEEYGKPQYPLNCAEKKNALDVIP